MRFRGPIRSLLAASVAAVALAAAAWGGLAAASEARRGPASGGQMRAMTGPVRIAYLHHSTGEVVWTGGLHRRIYKVWHVAVPEVVKGWARDLWSGGVPEFIRRWNHEHGTDYRIVERSYPETRGGYPWANYPYDYWNLWVAHAGERRDRGELNLDDLAKEHDVIVFKHCFPVGRILDDGKPGDVSSSVKTLANYKVQYQALKERMHQFPEKRFIVWTGAALARPTTNADQARRSREFFDWVKNSWDEKGDNIFVWDFYELEADAEGFLDPAHARGPRDSHPAAHFARSVAPLIGRRIVDVIEGRGDEASITGDPQDARVSEVSHAGGTR